MLEFDVVQVERDLGQVIRELRIKRDLSQRELADTAQVGLTALRSLEKGKGSTVTTLSKVVHALGRDTWLAMLDDANAKPKPLKKKKKKLSDESGEKRRRVAKRSKKENAGASRKDDSSSGKKENPKSDAK